MHARHTFIATSFLTATLGAISAGATGEGAIEIERPEYSVTAMQDTFLLLERDSGKTWFLRTTSGEPVWVPIRRVDDELPDVENGQPEQEDPPSSLANQKAYQSLSEPPSGAKHQPDAMAQYSAYLYQVKDPSKKGSYRSATRETEHMAFDFSSVLDGVPEGDLVDKERRLAWRTASDDLQDHKVVAELSARLDELARVSAQEGRSSPANLCAMESALLKTKPGIFPDESESADRFAELYRWRAHANYQPETSALDVVRDMERYASMDGDLNEFDMRLVLFAAYYSWRNAIEGETKYAVRVGWALDKVLAQADAETIQDAMEYLEQAAARRGDHDKEFPALYLMHGLTLLRSNPDVATKAESWLESHRSIYARRLAKIEPQLELLESLLAVDNG